MRADPRLCVARAWLLLDMGRLDEVGRWIACGEAAGGGDLTAQRDLAVLRATHRFKIGDLGATRAAARRVLELDDGAASFAATVAHLQLGITAFWSGDVPAVTRPLAEAVRMARRTGNVLAETYGLGYLALAAADSGDLVDAARRVPLALERDADPGVAEHFVAALPHLARATLLAASGRADGAADGGGPGADARPARRGSAGARAGPRRAGTDLGLRRAATAGAARRGTAHRTGLPGPRTAPDPARPDPHRTRVPRAARHPPRAAAAGIVLSERERELLPLLAGTLSQREIGDVSCTCR